MQIKELSTVNFMVVVYFSSICGSNLHPTAFKAPDHIGRDLGVVEPLQRHKQKQHKHKRPNANTISKVIQEIS